MEFIRVESVQGDRIFCVFEMSREEYARMVNERNRRAQIERENEQDWERERQWYRDIEED